jgi:hypothetical protein
MFGLLDAIAIRLQNSIRATNGWDDPLQENFAAIIDRCVNRLEVARSAPTAPRAPAWVWIDGTIDLSDADISRGLWIAASGIKGNLILASSHRDRLLSLRGSGAAHTPRRRPAM